MTVENTFGRWKGRFTRFSKRVDMEVSTLVSVTHASCILHNLCELQKNDFLPLWRENEDEDVVVSMIMYCLTRKTFVMHWQICSVHSNRFQLRGQIKQ